MAHNAQQNVGSRQASPFSAVVINRHVTGSHSRFHSNHLIGHFRPSVQLAQNRDMLIWSSHMLQIRPGALFGDFGFDRIRR